MNVAEGRQKPCARVRLFCRSPHQYEKHVFLQWILAISMNYLYRKPENSQLSLIQIKPSYSLFWLFCCVPGTCVVYNMCVFVHVGAGTCVCIECDLNQLFQWLTWMQTVCAMLCNSHLARLKCSGFLILWLYSGQCGLQATKKNYFIGGWRFWTVHR